MIASDVEADTGSDSTWHKQKGYKRQRQNPYSKSKSITENMKFSRYCQ